MTLICRRRRAAAVWLAGWALCTAVAAPAMAGEGNCTVVVGQGRNPVAAEAASWDAVNDAFHAQVVSTLKATGRRVLPIVLSVDDIDPVEIPKMVLQRAADDGCATIVETAVFANDEAATLSARLRVYPVLPMTGSGVGITGFRIGEPVFVSQREVALTRMALDRFRPVALAGEMAAEYIAHSERPGR